MTMTMAVVRSALDFEEPDYESAKSLGHAALPYLEELAASEDVLLASKAVYLAGLINGELSSTILQRAAVHKNSILRATAASIISQLSNKISNKLFVALLNDSDLGVQNIALKFLPADLSSEVMQSIEQLAHGHSEPTIKKMAADILQQSSRARNMGKLATPHEKATGMGRDPTVAATELGMGQTNKSSEMGSPTSNEFAVANGMSRQSLKIPIGMGAAAENSAIGKTSDAALFWEKAALAWERAAAVHDGGIIGKTGKKSCGCGSNPR